MARRRLGNAFTYTQYGLMNNQSKNLAAIRTPYGIFSRFLRTDKVKWRYEEIVAVAH